MEYLQRKATRLQGYDYGAAGAYFVTMCTQGRKCILSRISVGEGLAPPVVLLTQYGAVVEEQLTALEVRFPAVRVDKYVIMPNHVHAIFRIREKAGGASPSPTVVDVVRVLKSMTARLCPGSRLWQRSFHDHVIRDQNDYDRIWAYIDTNPAKWAEDKYYML